MFISRAFRLVLFLSSYTPLYLMLAVQFVLSPHYASFKPAPLTLVALALISTLGILYFIRWTSTTSPRRITIVRVQRNDAEVMAYLVSYVLPLASIDLSKPPRELIGPLVSLGIFFVFLLMVFLRTNMIHINPVLNLLGYYIYEFEATDGTLNTLISRRPRLRKGSGLDVVPLAENLFMERPHESS